jgi:cytochrome oxidase Cu insertion factor (SCO1/SenC/PrrC family)
MPRRYLALALVAAAGATAAIVAVTLASGGSEPPAPTAASGLVDGFYGPTAPPSMRAIDFSLRDDAGQMIHLRNYAGEPVVLVFIDSICKAVCPVVGEQLRGTLGELHRPVPVIALSVDPTVDTRAHVRRFLAAADLSGRVLYIAGPRRALAPIWRFFGIESQLPIASRSANFSLDIELLDKTGKPRVGYTELNQLDPDLIAHDIETLTQEPMPRTAPRRVELP